MEDRNWLSQQLQQLMTAYAYNLYAHANRARADDLLVRQRVSDALGAAASHLTRLAADYRSECVPPSTREQPFPPPEVMALLKRMEGLRAAVSLLASRIRGMPVPTQDRTWAKFRDEDSLLDSLLRRDYQLIAAAGAVEQYAGSMTAAGWGDAAAIELRTRLAAVEEAARARDTLLTSVA